MTDYDKELREAWERWNAEIIPEEFAKTAFKATFKVIDTQPTIEAEPNSCEYWDGESQFCALRRPQAEPVKHGRWIIGIGENGEPIGTYCSECGWSWERNIAAIQLNKVLSLIKTPRCPYCEAKMDEVEE